MGNSRFRQIGGRNYRSWKQWEAGDYVVGRYIQNYTDNYGKTCIELEVQECNFDTSLVGKNLGVNHNGSIQYKILDEDIPFGTIIKLEYNGKGELTKGKYAGKEFHDVSIWVADDSDLVSQHSGDSDL